MTTTGEALLAAVLAEPEDDLPRLIYADWLEENGQPERAEFIRVQIELMRAELMPDGTMRAGCREDDSKDLMLRVRQGELIDRGVADITAQLPHPWKGCYRRDMVYCRGFAAEVRCTLAEWCGGECPTCSRVDAGVPLDRVCPDCNGTGRIAGIGPELVHTHPIERVDVTDIRPWAGSYSLTTHHQNTFGWWATRDNKEILDIIAADKRRLPTPQDYRPGNGGHGGVFFDHEAAAKDALSKALIQWAKKQSPT